MSDKRAKFLNVAERSPKQIVAVQVLQGKDNLKVALEFARHTSFIEADDLAIAIRNKSIAVWDWRYNQVRQAEIGDYILKHSDAEADQVHLWVCTAEEFENQYEIKP